MESIIVYLKDEKQKSLLKSLLEELKVRFEIGEDDTTLTEEEFYTKIDKSIQQSKEGKINTLSKGKQKEILGL